ncbi:hypothetical protein ALC60_02307, partial [Trachymyrmex zeteki]
KTEEQPAKVSSRQTQCGTSDCTVSQVVLLPLGRPRLIPIDGSRATLSSAKWNFGNSSDKFRKSLFKHTLAPTHLPLPLPRVPRSSASPPSLFSTSTTLSCPVLVAPSTPPTYLESRFTQALPGSTHPPLRLQEKVENCDYKDFPGIPPPPGVSPRFLLTWEGVRNREKEDGDERSAEQPWTGARKRQARHRNPGLPLRWTNFSLRANFAFDKTAHFTFRTSASFGVEIAFRDNEQRRKKKLKQNSGYESFDEAEDKVEETKECCSALPCLSPAQNWKQLTNSEETAERKRNVQAKTREIKKMKNSKWKTAALFPKADEKGRVGPEEEGGENGAFNVADKSVTFENAKHSPWVATKSSMVKSVEAIVVGEGDVCGVVQQQSQHVIPFLRDRVVKRITVDNEWNRTIHLDSLQNWINASASFGFGGYDSNDTYELQPVIGLVEDDELTNESFKTSARRKANLDFKCRCHSKSEEQSFNVTDEYNVAKQLLSPLCRHALHTGAQPTLISRCAIEKIIESESRPPSVQPEKRRWAVNCYTGTRSVRFLHGGIACPSERYYRSRIMGDTLIRR